MIRIGIIGTGNMAHGHAEAFSKIKGVKLAACCDVREDRACAFAEKWKISRFFTDYRQMLDDEPLDGISNVTVDAQHAAVSIAAIERNIGILCEKPLATTLTEARAMTAALKKHPVANLVNFSYRNSPGLQGAATAITRGRIGRIRHVESSYLQSWLVSKAWGDWRTSPNLLWRLSTRHGSAGTLGDIGCHIFDLTALLCGDVKTIHCQLKTFDKGIDKTRLGEYRLDANDSFTANVTFANGALGVIHSTRWGTGHMNSLRARVYGDKGAIEVDLDRDWNSYKICRGQDCVDGATWQIVACKPTPTNYQRFIKGLRTGRPDPSDFANGLKIQACLHWSIESNRLNKRCSVKW